MKYFVEKSEFDFGRSQFLEISNEHSNNQRPREINIIEGCYTFHLYLVPWGSEYLICVWFNYDKIFNLNHWDEVLGIPKFISPNEFKKYKKLMAKPFPNYIAAYDRGSKKDFSAPALYRIDDFDTPCSKKWVVCQLAICNTYNSQQFLNECNEILRFVIQMLSQIQKNEIDWKDRTLLNLKEGIKMGVKSYFAPFSLFSDIISDIDWIDIAKNDPNW